MSAVYEVAAILNDRPAAPPDADENWIYPPPNSSTDPSIDIEDIPHKPDERYEYLIKWLGYSLNDATWEPASSLHDCEQIYQKYRNEKIDKILKRRMAKQKDEESRQLRLAQRMQQVEESRADLQKPFITTPSKRASHSNELLQFCATCNKIPITSNSCENGNCEKCCLKSNEHCIQHKGEGEDEIIVTTGNRNAILKLDATTDKVSLVNQLKHDPKIAIEDEKGEIQELTPKKRKSSTPRTSTSHKGKKNRTKKSRMSTEDMNAALAEADAEAMADAGMHDEQEKKYDQVTSDGTPDAKKITSSSAAATTTETVPVMSAYEASRLAGSQSLDMTETSEKQPESQPESVPEPQSQPESESASAPEPEPKPEPKSKSKSTAPSTSIETDDSIDIDIDTASDAPLISPSPSPPPSPPPSDDGLMILCVNCSRRPVIHGSCDNRCCQTCCMRKKDPCKPHGKPERVPARSRSRARSRSPAPAKSPAKLAKPPAKSPAKRPIESVVEPAPVSSSPTTAEMSDPSVTEAAAVVAEMSNAPTTPKITSTPVIVSTSATSTTPPRVIKATKSIAPRKPASPIPQVTIPDDDDDAIIVKDVDADVDVAVDVNMPPSTLPELYLLCNKCSRAIQAETCDQNRCEECCIKSKTDICYKHKPEIIAQRERARQERLAKQLEARRKKMEEKEKQMEQEQKKQLEKEKQEEEQVKRQVEAATTTASTIESKESKKDGDETEDDENAPLTTISLTSTSHKRKKSNKGKLTLTKSRKSTSSTSSKKKKKSVKEPEDEEYEVEQILDREWSEKRGEFLYKIRWRGYDSSHDSWEPVDSLIGCMEMRQAYDAACAVAAKETLLDLPKQRSATRREAMKAAKILVATKQAGATQTTTKKRKAVDDMESRSSKQYRGDVSRSPSPSSPLPIPVRVIKVASQDAAPRIILDIVGDSEEESDDEETEAVEEEPVKKSIKKKPAMKTATTKTKKTSTKAVTTRPPTTRTPIPPPAAIASDNISPDYVACHIDGCTKMFYHPFFLVKHQRQKHPHYNIPQAMIDAAAMYVPPPSDKPATTTTSTTNASNKGATTVTATSASPSPEPTPSPSPSPSASEAASPTETTLAPTSKPTATTEANITESAATSTSTSTDTTMTDTTSTAAATEPNTGMEVESTHQPSQSQESSQEQPQEQSKESSLQAPSQSQPESEQSQSQSESQSHDADTEEKHGSAPSQMDTESSPDVTESTDPSTAPSSSLPPRDISSDVPTAVATSTDVSSQLLFESAPSRVPDSLDTFLSSEETMSIPQPSSSPDIPLAVAGAGDAATIITSESEVDSAQMVPMSDDHQIQF